ncbi:hypothetical protein M0Q97_13765 [Candidatus Dojkabacteria bacterium]|jgi:hypothetical protein|nr:hypothetical protein [Candidatus Dojkabacteria bacterium]
MYTLSNLTSKVANSISEYIEFDVNEIFNASDYITIYGGAVRDSLAELEIHDIDILCMYNSARKLYKFLLTKGYSNLDLFDLDALNMYKEISVIAEPWTLQNKNGKIIQIIRPRAEHLKLKETRNYLEYAYIESYKKLLTNVDISCCGVFLEKDKSNNNLKISESCPNAIVQCLTKSFIINKEASQYNNNRIHRRLDKLISRGWMNLNNENIQPWEENEYKIKKTRKERHIKLCMLKFKPEYDYIIWNNDYNIKNEPLKKC